MSVAIEPIVEHHVEGFHRVLDCVARERRYIALTKAPPLASVRKFARTNIAKGLPHYVAVNDGAVVGWCDITPASDRRTFAHRGVLGMGLLPAYRGRGHGSALLGTAMAHARRAGFVRVELTVYADNAPAVALYRKHGFVDEGLLRDGAYINGTFRDLLQMASIDRGALRM